MIIARGLEETESLRGGIVSIGNFDGVHRGHRSILAVLIGRARSLGIPAVVMTFDPHPIALLRPSVAPTPLVTPARRLELLKQCGVDAVLVYPTDRAFLELSPEEFFRGVVQERLAARGLVEGSNFCFGRDRAGTIGRLQGLCTAVGLTLEVIAPLAVEGRTVSSSEIRRLIAGGEVALGGKLLGEPYSLSGRVVRGAARGRTIGFPTANLAEISTILPGEGVYAAGSVIDGVSYAAAINVGGNPTFADHQRKVEVHLLDYQGDLYDRWIDVEFLEKLRDTVPFANVEALMRQLQQDVSAARQIVARRASGD
ncbi:MAG: bifunctional riboflavin kinase/FAD synthetase [Planctomycetales bacterium]